MLHKGNTHKQYNKIETFLQEAPQITSVFYFVVSLSVSVSQGNFGGLCMLYGLVSYNATTSAIGVQSSSPSSLCYFVSAISVMVAVVCFSLSLYLLYTFCIDGDIRR